MLTADILVSRFFHAFFEYIFFQKTISTNVNEFPHMSIDI